MPGSPPADTAHDVVGWRCATCSAAVPLTEPTPWRCPNSTPVDRRHLLQIVRATDRADHPLDGSDVNPFLRYDRRLAWAASAAARGLTADERRRLVVELDEATASVAGTGFVPTPFRRSSDLSDLLGFTSEGGVWVKDETGNVGGSQKARHLFTILLHLLATEALDGSTERPPLAIASCGNAALSAAILARAAEWPLDVYVPTWMDDAFGRELDRLGATTHRCAARDEDPPGDPAMFRFREAVADGAVPFTVQGPENALCLDGGRTIGWELAEQVTEADGPGRLDAVFVQVGGGAFATCVGNGLHELGLQVPLYAVQAEGCAPFDRAVRRSVDLAEPATAWSDVMTPWERPTSLADGILDDETYDWVGVLHAVRRSGGGSVVAAEHHIHRAHQILAELGAPVSATGAAGLAGLLQLLDGDHRALAPDARVAIVWSGVAR